MSDVSFFAVLRLLRVAAALEARFAPALGAVHGLGLGEVLLLLQLAGSPSGRLRRVDLAGRLHVSQSTITRMCLPLEKSGLIRREPDVRDGRVGYVALTDSGRERIQETAPTLGRLAGEMFRDRWTEEEIATLSGLLGRLSSPLPGDAELGSPTLAI